MDERCAEAEFGDHFGSTGLGGCADFRATDVYVLVHLCALAIVRGAPDHIGLEAWRLLHEWYQPKTRSRGLALLNELLGWDFGTKEQFLQRRKNWENATLEYNRTASAPFQEEVLVAVLISRSPKEIRTSLHVQVREETAKLSHVRQLLHDYLRAGKAWKAPRTEQGKNKGTETDTTAKAKVNSAGMSNFFDGTCNNCGAHGHKRVD